MEATSHSDLGGPNLLQLGRMWRILLAVQVSIRGSYKAEDKAGTPNSIQFNGVVIDVVVGIRFRLRATCFVRGCVRLYRNHHRRKPTTDPTRRTAATDTPAIMTVFLVELEAGAGAGVGMMLGSASKE